MNKELENNRTISHYKILSSIGKGGMGEVFLAQDTKLNRKAALKILPAEFAEDSDRMNRFVREAQSASALNHPNIITIYEIGESEGTHFIATEFIDGVTLSDYVKANPLNYKSALEIAVQLASALDEAHQAGVVHRDIKPDNIMIRADNLAKILDFGIAKLSTPTESSEEAATAIRAQTQAGMIIGTPNYMSPEQARGRDVDSQTDIFSFGVVLYEMLSGAAPFKGETISDVIAAVLTKEPKRLRDVPPELAEIVHKTLQKDKRHRYRTANDLLRDLKEVKQELESQDKLERTSPPNREEIKTQILKAPTTAEANPQSAIQNLKSVVVLPFANISTDEDNEYFSDGLTEEIISDLSKIRALRVISRNSAMKLKGTAKGLRTITEELNVRYVLDGSVRKAGQNLRISVQLIDGATDANLWAEKYSGSLDDIFEIQESVSRSIAEALKITLTTGEIEQIEERPITDAQAYDLYLQARAEFWQGNPAALDRSIELLKQGLEIIGENELLYAALGYTHYFYFRWISKLDINHLNAAEEYLQKTFAINPASSHGLTLKGLLSYSRGQMPETIASLTKAVESDPVNTEALLWLVVNLNYIGRGEDSKQYAERLISIDPLTPINIFIFGFAHVYNGEVAKSLPFLKRTLAIDSSSPLIIWSAVVVEAWCGNVDEAIAYADRLDEIAPGWVYTEHALFLKHALRGEKEIALEHYTPDFDKEAAYDCHFALHIAHCFALIGEKEKALDFLEIAVRTGMVNYPFLSRFDPLLENIRREPRFLSLMAEAKQLSEEINNSTPGSDFRGESENLEEPQTQILQTPTTAGKAKTLTTGSEDGFWIAVLPFKYRGANADLEDLAEGLSEEIITGLSRFSYLRVIARGSTLSYADDAGDVRAIGKELGARYVLEGNLRQAGTKLRLAVRLVDAATGGNLWAENFEREFSLEAVFELQDDLVPRIVSTCADHFGVLVRSISDAVRGKDPEHLSPYEALMRGFGYHYLLNPQDHAEARDVLEKAVAESPNNADCRAMLSWVYSHEFAHGFNPRSGSLDRAIAAARRAVELAPSNPLAYQTLAVAHFFRKEKAACLSAAERALSLNPLGASNEAIFLITFADDWERGCALIRRAMQLNPYCPGWYRLILGLNEYRKTNYRETAAEAVKANTTGGWADVIFAAIYGQLGEHAAARDAVQNLIAAKMDSLEAVRELGAKWFDAQLVEHLLEGIGKAGLKIATATNEQEQKTQILGAQTTAEEKPTEVGTQNSIAVLPFTNMSADGDNEYFCDGLAEELLNALSKIEDLKVAARTSAFSFKGKNANASEIGEKLAVKNILEGSVRRSGNKLRISVQLINAADGYQLWSERYDREMKDIFDVQDEIALAVVDALKLKLFGDEKDALLKRYTNNPEAYQLYLKGRFYFSKFTVEGFGKSVEYYEQALAIEPDYAPAFAALSTSYICFWYLGFGETAKYISKAQATVNQALALDQSLAEAHFALALVKFNYERN